MKSFHKGHCYKQGGYPTLEGKEKTLHSLNRIHECRKIEVKIFKVDVLLIVRIENICAKGFAANDMWLVQGARLVQYRWKRCGEVLEGLLERHVVESVETRGKGGYRRSTEC